MNRSKIWVVPVLVAALVFSPMGFSALAETGGTQGEPTGEQMVADLFLLRPVGIIATAFGAACFLVTLPFSGPTETADTTWQKLVVDPAKFTFQRPVGDVQY